MGTQLKKKLNDEMKEKAEKKHKNYLRRQRAKQAKLAAKEKEVQEAAENIKKQPEQINNNNNKFDTLSLSGSDSGVSVKSGNSTKNVQKKKLNLPKVKTVQKYSVVKTPEIVMNSPEVRQPVFNSGITGNFVNQGKL